MKIKSDALINDLIARTEQYIRDAEQLKKTEPTDLNKRNGPNQWSALECIQHLNLYGEFYLPEIIKRIQESRHDTELIFKSGWLGNYFAEMMLPKEKLNKIKTFKDNNPLGSQLDISTIDRFIKQQHQMIEMLEQSRKISLTKTKTAISISRWIKLRLGDTFRVVIYHNQRHIKQAYRAIA